MSVISSKRLNGLLSAIKLSNAFGELGLVSCEKRATLVKLVLREPKFKKNANVPFYAFVKHTKGFVAVADLLTGGTEVIEASTVASETEVKGNFRIDGVTYGVKDTVNGFKRYRPLSVEPRKPRKRLTPLSPEVVDEITAAQSIE